MRVRQIKGLPIHFDPVPFAAIREDVGEASAGVRIGQPLRHESDLTRGAGAPSVVETRTNI